MVDSSPAARTPLRGRLLAIVGLCLPVLGVAAYVVQLRLQRLMMPWYVPGLAWLGVVLVILSLVERRTLARGLALVVVLLLAVAELALLQAMRLPAYTGPIAVGRPFPAFATRTAQGESFSQADLAGKRNNVLVFFRGRW